MAVYTHLPLDSLESSKDALSYLKYCSISLLWGKGQRTGGGVPVSHEASQGQKAQDGLGFRVDVSEEVIPASSPLSPEAKSNRPTAATHPTGGQLSTQRIEPEPSCRSLRPALLCAQFSLPAGPGWCKWKI